MIAIRHHYFWLIVNYLLAALSAIFLLPFVWSILIVVALLGAFFSQFFLQSRHIHNNYIGFVEGDYPHWTLCWFGKSYDDLQLVDSICLFQRIVFLRFKFFSHRRGLSVMAFFKKNQQEDLRKLQKMVFHGVG